MVDVAVAAQLQQWTFEKPALATRPERASSDSSSSSPKLCDDVPDTLRIDPTPVQDSIPPSRKESLVMQERYLSSEESLTADDGDNSESDEYDYDDVVVHDAVKECKARTLSISRWDKGRSCDMAVMVSYAFVGRPKVVEMDCRSPITERPMGQQRSASLANLPIAAISKLRKMEKARMSMAVTPSSRLSSSPVTRSASPSPFPVFDNESRRPSTSHCAVATNTSALELTDSNSTTSSFQTAPSTRSSSPASSEEAPRPVTSAEPPASARSSVYIPSGSRIDLSRIHAGQASYRQSQFAPLTPSSPALSFLSSDPYENSNTNAASPIIKKPTAHKRLRSISMKLALAKIAISPSKKPYDSRINGKGPATPSTPFSPMTPQTAPLENTSTFSTPNRLRRASTILRPKSRHGDSTRVPTPESAPPVPSIKASSIAEKRMTKMVARGADERQPAITLPPCPVDEDPMGSIKSKRLRKRKSILDLLQT
ncbi:hypothetical protein IQ07DRAFT_593332 [Pyrenochaeta sp. DS3sAY3a]|nr:hypothetical protein IQ07DRAFT_593332 [Pyrenochaeta sp. DS3sAY3a]